MEATVSEIHSYPARPPDRPEPLFSTPESRREILEHFSESSWLWRASDLREATGVSAPVSAAGGTAHVRGEAVELEVSAGRVEVVRLRSFAGRGSRRQECQRSLRVVEVIERWREVKRWWDPERSVDRLLFRVAVSGEAVSGGAVVDLARERDSGEWTLVGIVD